MKFVFLLFILINVSFAGDVSKETKFLVKSVDGTDLESLQSNSIKVVPTARKVASSSILPPISWREEVFDQSGLNPQLKDWDDFEKDSLYLKLRVKGDKAIDEIQKKFPELKRQGLLKAQKMISQEERQ